MLWTFFNQLNKSCFTLQHKLMNYVNIKFFEFLQQDFDLFVVSDFILLLAT